MNSAESVKNTPLFEAHQRHGARMVDFVGFRMPLQYSGVVDEHRTVRATVGLFDVSHMGQVVFTGPSAVATVHRLVTNNVAALKDGQVLYTPVCYPDGGIVDDCLVYRFEEQRLLIVVNAANIKKDYEWFVEQTGQQCHVDNVSDDHALLALQGREACRILDSLADGSLTDIPPFSFVRTKVNGIECVASRTGYTGEDGFEIDCAPPDAEALWTCLMEAGASHGIKPCGLGARDTLRLEAKLCLYGNDIDAKTTPLEAGLGWTVKLKAGEFIGSDVLRKQKKEGVKTKLVCMEMQTRGIARQGHEIHLINDDHTMGDRVGSITSGTKSPHLNKAIAMGYVPADCSKPGTRVLVNVRGKGVEAEVIKGPFYKRDY